MLTLPTGLFAIDGPLNTMEFPLRMDYWYSTLTDPTESYYKDDNNKLTKETFLENNTPLNEEEIKLVRRILPYRLTASKYRLKMYVDEKELELKNILNETERENETARDNLNAVHERYTDALKDLTKVLKEINHTKAQIEFYQNLDSFMDEKVKEVISKLNKLKI